MRTRASHTTTTTRRRSRKIITRRSLGPNRIVRQFTDDCGVRCMEIALQGELSFLIEARDYKMIRSTHWTGNRTPSGIYVRAGRDNIYAHRVIMGEPARGLCVDHINANPLDCRRSNLRVVNYSINLQRMRSHNSTGFRGVYRSGRGKYAAGISHLGYKQHLGTFATAIEAAQAYNTAALDLYGEHAGLNNLEVIDDTK